jgi:hypothetical protein
LLVLRLSHRVVTLVTGLAFIGGAALLVLQA